LDEAEILLEIGDLANALSSACNAASLARDLNLGFETGKAQLFEAAAQLRSGDTEAAASAVKEARRFFERERNNVWTALAKLQISLLLEQIRSDDAAQEAFGAKQLLADAGLPHRLAFADIVIGRLARRRGDWDAATAALRSALDLAEQGQSAWMQFHAAHELGICLDHTDPAASLKLFERAEVLLDGLWDKVGADDLKLAFLVDRDNVYTRLVGFRLEQSVELAFEASEKSRSRVLRERLNAGAPRAEAVQRQLREDEVLLEYFTDGVDLTTFAVTRAGIECVRQPGVARLLKERQESFDRHLAGCSVKWERLAAAREHLLATAKSHLQAMFDLLIAPVAFALKPRMVVVPHGFLHGVPFHALWDGSAYVLDSRRVTYSPSAALYCAPAEDAPYGPPLFVAFVPDGGITGAEEIAEAAAFFPGADVAVNPSIADLRDLLATPRSLIHMAGHAGIDPIGGTLSWIETDSGRLTGRDLAGMGARAETLVITGCRTARRAISAGDEWQGLMRAFYLAGASGIVSAFWDIRDDSARRFASEFYRRFPHDETAEAVCAASRALRDENPHPYFWAGFAAFGRRRLSKESGEIR
jgi:hypothetical protein